MQTVVRILLLHLPENACIVEKYSG